MLSKKSSQHTHTVGNYDEINFNLKQDVPRRNVVDVPRIAINNALQSVYRQLLATGRRMKTVETYDYCFQLYIGATGIKYVDEICADNLIAFIDSMDNVALTTKKFRLKSIKAVLLRFFENGWLPEMFWRRIDVKIDNEVKEGSDIADLAYLIESIDKSTFTGFRDAVAILLLFKTGIRITTLAKLKNHHIDFDEQELRLDGSIMKNRKPLYLPLDDMICKQLKLLIEHNNIVRRHNKRRNNYVFINRLGASLIETHSNTNAISRSLSNYAKKFDLKNINAHAIRRAYAKNLLDQGANIAIISKALGHSSLSVTTEYLHFELEEVSDKLRDYM